MIERRDYEQRIVYLIRALHYFMNETASGKQKIEYDAIELDGMHLAQDIDSEVCCLLRMLR